jgi:hypothetical protein
MVRILAQQDHMRQAGSQDTVDLFNVPLISNGQASAEDYVRKRIQREVETALWVAPFVRFFGYSRSWYIIPRKALITAVILVIVCAVIVGIYLMRL